MWKIAKMYGVDFEELKAANLQLLIVEHPDFLRVLEEQPAGLRYPNELFREWLAFLQKPHPKKQERLLAFSAKAIENHRKLWYDGYYETLVTAATV
ncbi:hypothetical protein [Chryseomicrobium excrementi]|uniref:hypothetical protein n=1 Tax=Chryseomicrobium excrementi TaxID=2041346 RepID=UPI003CCC06CD